MKKTLKVLFWGRWLFWLIVLYAGITVVGNFLIAPVGFKRAELPREFDAVLWIGTGAGIVAVLAKMALGSGNQRDEERRKARKLAGDNALAVHGHVISEAKRLCAIEGLTCDEYGCPEQRPNLMDDNSQASKDKYKAARRVAEAHKPILLNTLRDAIGDELMAKLGQCERYVHPVSGHGHDGILAYCNLEFNHVEGSLFHGVLPPKMNSIRAEAYASPEDRNIEVRHAATFGVFDPGHGEQYVPGDLLVVVGVWISDDRTSYYSPQQYQVNPTAGNFLKELVGLESLPIRRTRTPGATSKRLA